MKSHTATSILDSALLRPVEAAIYIGVTDSQLRHSRYTGDLFNGVPTPSYIKLGRTVLYRKSTLDSWISKLPEFRNTSEVNASLRQDLGSKQ